MNSIYYANRVDPLTGEESIYLMADPANTDPTLTCFYEVNHAAKKGSQSQSGIGQHCRTHTVRQVTETGCSHCSEPGTQEEGDRYATA